MIIVLSDKTGTEAASGGQYKLILNSPAASTEFVDAIVARCPDCMVTTVDDLDSDTSTHSWMKPYLMAYSVHCKDDLQYTKTWFNGEAQSSANPIPPLIASDLTEDLLKLHDLCVEEGFLCVSVLPVDHVGNDSWKYVYVKLNNYLGTLSLFEHGPNNPATLVLTFGDNNAKLADDSIMHQTLIGRPTIQVYDIRFPSSVLGFQVMNWYSIETDTAVGIKLNFSNVTEFFQWAVSLGRFCDVEFERGPRGASGMEKSSSDDESEISVMDDPHDWGSAPCISGCRSTQSKTNTS